MDSEHANKQDMIHPTSINPPDGIVNRNHREVNARGNSDLEASPDERKSGNATVADFEWPCTSTQSNLNRSLWYSDSMIWSRNKYPVWLIENDQDSRLGLETSRPMGQKTYWYSTIHGVTYHGWSKTELQDLICYTHMAEVSKKDTVHTECEKKLRAALVEKDEIILMLTAKLAQSDNEFNLLIEIVAEVKRARAERLGLVGVELNPGEGFYTIRDYSRTLTNARVQVNDVLAEGNNGRLVWKDLEIGMTSYYLYNPYLLRPVWVFFYTSPESAGAHDFASGEGNMSEQSQLLKIMAFYTTGPPKGLNYKVNFKDFTLPTNYVLRVAFVYPRNTTPDTVTANFTVWTRMIGIEPNPGWSLSTKIRNRLQHALNGNMEEDDVSVDLSLLQFDEPSYSQFSPEEGEKTESVDLSTSSTPRSARVEREIHLPPTSRIREDTVEAEGADLWNLRMNKFAKTISTSTPFADRTLYYLLAALGGEEVVCTAPVPSNVDVVETFIKAEPSARDNFVKNRAGRNRKNKDNKRNGEKGEGFTPKDKQELDDIALVEYLREDGKRHLQQVFCTIAAQGAHELLGPLREVITDNRYNCPIDRILCNYLCGKYLHQADFLAAMATVQSKAFNCTQLTSRDSIRNLLVTVTAMTPSTLLEAISAGHSRLTHALHGNIADYETAFALRSRKAHNKLQHSLNGNTDFPVVSASASILEKAVRYMSALMYNTNPTIYSHAPNYTIALRSWAREQKPISGTYDSVGFQGIMSYYENWLADNSFMAQNNENAPAYADFNLRNLIMPNLGGAHIALKPGKFAEALMQSISLGEVSLASQTMRINTSLTSGDAWQMCVMANGSKYKAGLYGSFATILAKAFLYSVAEVPLLGPESSSYQCNFNTVLTPTAPAQSNRWFYFNPQGDFQAAPPVEARICTYSEFQSYQAGFNQDWDPQFGSQQWGVTVAVVPITMDLLNNPVGAATWSLLHLEYPYQSLQWEVEFLEDDDTAVTGAKQAFGLASQTRIPGVMGKILYVVCDAARGYNVSIVIGTPAANVVATTNTNGITGNSIDIGPGLAAVYASRARFGQGLVVAINYWCRKLGNREDWLAALFVAADKSYSLAPPVCVTGETSINGYRQGPNDDEFYDMDTLTRPTTAQARNKHEATFFPWGVVSADTDTGMRFPTAFETQMSGVDPAVEVDKMSGFLTAVYPVSWKVPSNMFEVAYLVRQLARAQTMTTDIIYRDTGIGIGELFSGGATQVYSAMASNQHMVWTDIFNTKSNILKQMGINVLTYDVGPALSVTREYFSNVFGPGGEYFGGSGIIPYSIFVTTGIVDSHPVKAETKPLPDHQTALGYIGNDDPVDVSLATPPKMGSDTDWLNYTGRLYSQFSATKNTLELAMTIKGATRFRPYASFTTTPNITIAICFTMRNFNAPSATQFNCFDLQMCPTMPGFSIIYANDLWPAFFGQSQYRYMVKPVPDLTAFVLQVGSLVPPPSRMALPSNRLTARLSEPGDSFRNPPKVSGVTTPVATALSGQPETTDTDSTG